jgi:hypothetical protein
MAMEKIQVEAGSGDVFADLGYADSKERRLKVELALEVNRVLEEAERLMEFLTRLGKDVEIRIAPKRSGRKRSAVQVHHLR